MIQQVFIVLSTLYLMAWLHREQYNLELTLVNSKLAKDQFWTLALYIDTILLQPVFHYADLNFMIIIMNN